MRRSPLDVLAVVCAVLLATAGCSTHIRGPAVPRTISKLLYSDREFTEDWTNYHKPATTPAEARGTRNRMAHGIMADIEFSFRDYESLLFIDRGKFAIGSDFLELGLTTAGTISKVTFTKTILSALVGGAAGMRISVDKNLFREKTVEAIISSMEARRAIIETRILQQLAKDTNDYPLEAAMKDLREYFFAGTLQGGLTELTQQAAATAKTNQENLDKAKIVVSATKEDLTTAAAINTALGKMIASKNFAPLIAFLNAMGTTVDDKTPSAELERAYRELAMKTLTDAALRKKFFEEAKKAKLIE